MYYHVYILYSPSKDLFYNGITTNISKRIYYHNNASDGFTAHGRPWKILWTTEKNSKPEAEILERKIKNLSRKRKFDY